MQCYTELTPPTAVSHALSLPFTSSVGSNLIVVKSSLLQIFSLKSVISNVIASQPATNGLQNGDRTYPTSARPERVQSTKLVLVAEYSLAGEVTSIARVKILRSKSGGEALIVALRDAKLSLIEWDPERHTISTISLHYYEREDVLSNPFEPDLSQYGSILTVDPSSRCAIFKFGLRHIAILPFRQVGDDIAMDDFDEEADGSKLEKKVSAAQSASEEIASKTPYAASFVLSLLALDPSLRHPVHMSFLNEYREPTFGILSLQNDQSVGASGERRMTTTYSVYTLDLEQRASTTLLSVGNLPMDLYKVLPMSNAVEGALLIGSNELIHVDQSGKTNGIAVNQCSKESSTIPLADQADLGLELESCLVQQLGPDNPDLILVDNRANLFMLSFKIDGRSISGLTLQQVDRLKSPALSRASCATLLGRGRMFIGSCESDSLLLGWSRNTDKLKRQRSYDNNAEQSDELMDEEDIDLDADEDDLYASEPAAAGALSATAVSNSGELDDYQFRVHDSLMNLSPMTGMTFGLMPVPDASTKSSVSFHQELMTTSGKGQAGALTSLASHLHAECRETFAAAGSDIVWSISTQDSNRATHDIYLFVATEGEDTRTLAYDVREDGLHQVQGTDLEPDAGMTIGMGTLHDSKRIIQVLPTEARAFDADLGLAQIVPLSDDDNSNPSVVVQSHFAEPFVLLLQADQSILVLTTDDNGDLDEVSQGQEIRDTKHQSGCLYEDSNDALRLEFQDDEEAVSNVLLFLLSVDGGLFIYRLPGLQKPVYVAPGLGLVPPFLSPDFAVRRSTSAREFLAEILVADIGDSTAKAPFLILRNYYGDAIIYQPYHFSSDSSKDPVLHFLKLISDVPAPAANNTDFDARQSPKDFLTLLPDLNGLSCVMVPGVKMQLLVKTASSQIRLVKMALPDSTSVTAFNAPWCRRGFAYAHGSDSIKLANIPSDADFSLGWIMRRIKIHQEVNALAYHHSQKAYVLSVLDRVPFKLPLDEQLRNLPPESEPYLPEIETSSIHLFDRKTCTTIDKHSLEMYELATCVETVSLEVSENTHERKEMVCVGTTLIRGEDLPAVGFVYVFSVNDVVPEPEHPETARALKLICKEEVRGAVTGLSGVGTQGFLLIAQGQKCLVRGLKEDGSLLPVAFLDMQTHVTVTKELPGTGLCLMGDAIKGMWLSGYSEEPYQLRLFSKTPYQIETIAASFLPDGQSLHAIAIDADGNLHVFQYDPEHPRTLAGHLLLPTSTPFHTTEYPSSVMLIPSSTSHNHSHHTPHETHHQTSEHFLPPGSVLIASLSGSLSLVCAVPSSSHRLLSSLQSHLLNTLPQPLGLNAKAFRTPTATSKAGSAGGAGSAEMGMAGAGGIGRGFGGGGGLGIIDGNIMKRWNEPGSWRRWGGGEDIHDIRRAVWQAVGGMV